MKDWSILIVGVGGQGTLLASRVLGAAAGLTGRDVKVSEVHGMAQRGGSVVTYVRMGAKVHSPLIEPGEADVIIAFEQMEAMRYIEYAKKGALVVVNRQIISPMPVITGQAEYPDDILMGLERFSISLQAIDALLLARHAGSERAVNMVMLGAASKRMDMDEDIWLQAVQSCVPPKTVDINKAAFLAGRNA